MVWVLVDLPPSCKTVGSKWIFKKKTDMDGIVHVYKARLVAKCYLNLWLIMKKRSHLSLHKSYLSNSKSIAAYKDYEIWQMDFKTAFLNVTLDETSIWCNPEGFVDPNHPRKSSEAAMEAVWIRKFISGLGIVPTINEPLNMYCDNSAAVHYANEPGGEIRILKVHTDNNLADPFTKALSNRKLTQHARGMGLRPASSFM
ncbi:retrotransposon protein, putative, ty1-copia subclass [Tanacetum coccineum]